MTEIHGISDTGPVRRHNEDRFLIDEALGVAAVADGMGGHASGEVASSEALATLHHYLVTMLEDTPSPGAPADPDATCINQRWRYSAALRRGVVLANARVYAKNLQCGHDDGAGMGCTLTGFQIVPEMACVVTFHVGDSRLYRYRDGALTQLTRDHTAYQEALEFGTPGNLPPQNLLLQAVGPAALVSPDIAVHDLQADDILLVCSDGLHGWVPHAELEGLLGSDSASLGALCLQLIELAKRFGSRDNITALLARFP